MKIGFDDYPWLRVFVSARNGDERTHAYHKLYRSDGFDPLIFTYHVENYNPQTIETSFFTQRVYKIMYSENEKKRQNAKACSFIKDFDQCFAPYVKEIQDKYPNVYRFSEIVSADKPDKIYLGIGIDSTRGFVAAKLPHKYLEAANRKLQPLADYHEVDRVVRLLPQPIYEEIDEYMVPPQF